MLSRAFIAGSGGNPHIYGMTCAPAVSRESAAPRRPGRLVLAALARAALALAVLGAASSARADEDYERASRAVAAGEALPLAQIIDKARDAFGGRVLDADFEEGHGRPRYEVKLLTDDGRLLKLVYDAATGALLGEKEKPAAGQGRR